jgi:hypothetical protein
VLQGSFAEALPVLIEYLNFLDQVSFEIDNYFLIIGRKSFLVILKCYFDGRGKEKKSSKVGNFLTASRICEKTCNPSNSSGTEK